MHTYPPLSLEVCELFCNTTRLSTSSDCVPIGQSNCHTSVTIGHRLDTGPKYQSPKMGGGRAVHQIVLLAIIVLPMYVRYSSRYDTYFLRSQPIDASLTYAKLRILWCRLKGIGLHADMPTHITSVE